jgi:hypothetical protein
VFYSFMRTSLFLRLILTVSSRDLTKFNLNPRGLLALETG